MLSYLYHFLLLAPGGFLLGLSGAPLNTGTLIGALCFYFAGSFLPSMHTFWSNLHDSHK